MITQNVFAGASLHTVDYNYINDLIGGRATGLGGAFTAISDDPAGAYYNPAGLVFAIDNQISLSVNSYKSKNIEIEKVLSGNSYTQDISSFYPSFFGIVQSVGPLKLAFTIINVNNEILDQDEIYEVQAADDDPETAGVFPVTYNFNYNITDNTLFFGLSAATFITDNLTVGLTVYGLRRRTEQISNQTLIYTKGEDNTTYSLDNRYYTEIAYGSKYRLGVQWMPTNTLSLGLSVEYAMLHLHEMDGQVFEKDDYWDEQYRTGQLSIEKERDNLDRGKWSSSLPVNMRLGVAWFLSKELLISADIIADYISFKDNGDNFSLLLWDNNVNGMYYQNQVVNTLNFAVGSEYYVTKSFPVRLGFFTNFANSLKFNETDIKLSWADSESRNDLFQQMHVNLYGASLSLAWQTRNSSIALCGFYQYGKGVISQGSQSGPATQDVVVNLYSISLTGSAKY